MNFDLSDEQRLLQETVDDFLRTESSIARIREFYNGQDEVDRALWKGMGELGLLGVHLPEEFGGAGLELLDLVCVVERLGYAAAPGPYIAHSIASLAILLAGNKEQKESWLPRLATGECIGTVALAEDGDRWQPDQWTLTAEGDRLSGRKEHVLCARGADVVVVGLKDGGLALVESPHDDLLVTPTQGLDRTRRIATLDFEGVPCEILPGGASSSDRLRDAALVLLAGDAYGGAARCVELAVNYAGEREQFGRKIGEFQALKHQLANLALDAEPCRALAWYAAYAWDHLPEESARAAAHAKSHVTDRFVRVARGTVEAHGGIGYTWASEVHFWLKRAVFDRTFLGSPRVHRMRAANLAGW